MAAKDDKNQKRYESLTEKFNVNSIINIPEVMAIPAEGYSIKDLKDIEGKGKMFSMVKKLNLSDNFISRVRLREYNTIEELNVSKNMVGEVILNMTNLKTLNLSYNLIPKIFDLSDLPNLTNLNLSYNVIENISINDIIKVKKNLLDFDVSFNKIKLKSFEFISFFEGLKNFRLKKINLKENSFNTNSRLKEIYKIFISLCLPDLEMIDLEVYKINPKVVDINDIMKQILREESDKNCYEIINNYEKTAREYLMNNKFNNNNLNNQQVNKYVKNDNEEINYEKPQEEKKKLITIIQNIIKNLDDIYICKYDFQFIYLEIIQDIMNILSRNYEYEPNEKNEEEVQNCFPSLLNGLYTFIENNDEKEEFTIFKMIAYLAFIEKGAFCNVCFEFFKSVMYSSNSKSQYIGVVLKSVISDRLNEIINWENFSILKEISEFFDENLTINIDDIFDERINKFIEIFDTLWTEKTKKNNDDSNIDGDESNNQSYTDSEEVLNYSSDNSDRKNYENKMKLKTDLKITTLKITKRYFQIKVKQMKQDNYKNKNNFAVGVDDIHEINENLDLLTGENKEAFSENNGNELRRNSKYELIGEKENKENEDDIDSVFSSKISKDNRSKFTESLKESFVRIENKLNESRSKISKSRENINDHLENKNTPKGDERNSNKLDQNSYSKNSNGTLESKFKKSKKFHSHYMDINSPEISIPDIEAKGNSGFNMKANPRFLNTNSRNSFNINNNTENNNENDEENLEMEKSHSTINENNNLNFSKYKNSRLDNEPLDDIYNKGENILINNPNNSFNRKSRQLSNMVQEQSNKLITENSYSNKQNTLHNRENDFNDNDNEESVINDIDTILKSNNKNNNKKRTSNLRNNIPLKKNFKLENNKNNEEESLISYDNSMQSENQINFKKKTPNNDNEDEIYKDESMDSKINFSNLKNLLDPNNNKLLAGNRREIKQNVEKDEKLKTLNIANFRTFYIKICSYFMTNFPDFNHFLKNDDIELFLAFLDFSTFFYMNISDLIENEIICKKVQIYEELHNFFYSSKIMIYLKKLITEIVKKIKVEDLGDDDYYDVKFKSNFSKYFEKNSNVMDLRKIKKNNQDNEMVSIFRELIKFKELYVEIVKCLASCINLLEPDKFLNFLNEDIIKKIISVLKKNSFIDPFILDASISFILILLSDEKVKNDYILFINLVDKKNKFVNLRNLLNLIDNNHKTSQEFVFYLYTRILPKKITINQIDFNKVDNRINEYYSNIIKKVIYLFKKISKFMLLSNPLITKNAKEIISYLRNNHLEIYLGNCLKFENDDIRLSAIKTIYYGNKDNVDISILDVIMEIISDYDSITEGKTEFILSIVYLLFNKILCNQISKTKNLPHKFTNALVKSFEFMEKNLNRDPKEVEEIVQKNELAISLLLYMTTVSKYKFSEDDFKKQINNSRNREFFYQSMENDYFYYENSLYIPIEIERTLLGNKINNFTEITKRNPTMDPYSFNFLRILIKMADILCDIQDYSLNYSFDIKSREIIQNLIYYINRRFVFRVFNESLAWGDFMDNLDEKIVELKTVKKFTKLNKKRDQRLLKKTHEKLNIFKMNSIIIKSWRRKISENMETTNDLKNHKDLLEKGTEKIKEILEIHYKTADKQKEEKKLKKEKKHKRNTLINDIEPIPEAEDENEYNENENDEDNISILEKKIEKYFVLDYLGVIVKKYMKKMNNVNSNDNIISPVQQKNNEINNNSNLYEQIDFIIFFPNLLNCLLGKSLNTSRSEINLNLMNKFDKDLMEVIKMFKSVGKLSELKSLSVFNITNKLKMFEVKNYVKKGYIDKDEEKYWAKNRIKNSNRDGGDEEFKDLKDIIKVSYNNKINHDSNNYKEDYFINCLNFNKRIYANNFNKAFVRNIYWKNEVMSSLDFRKINKITRSKDIENENNSHLRSLLISALLRCLNPILCSKSKNITKKFIEILFSEKIYYDFFLYISSGLYLKYNIGGKVLTIFNNIFNDNFYYVKLHFEKLFFPHETKKDNYISSSKNYHDQINKFDKKFGNKISDNEFKFFSKILEIINIGSIFVNKIYYICYLKKNFHYSANHQFVNNFTSALNSILNAIINTNFPESIRDSLESFVINNFLQNSMLKNLLPFLSTIYNLNNKVNKLIYKKTLLKNFIFDHFGTTYTQTDQEIFLHLLRFKFYLMKSEGILKNLIAAIRFMCQDNKNIFLKELITFDYKNYIKAVRYKFQNKNKENRRKLQKKKNNYYIYEDNFLPNINFFENEKKAAPTSSGKDTTKIEEDELKNLKEKDDIDMATIRAKIIEDIFHREKLFRICNKLQLQYLNGEHIIFKTITEYCLLNTNEKYLAVLIVSHLNLYLFNIEVEPYHKYKELKLDNEKKYFKFDLQNFTQIKYFDYYSRVVLIGKKNLKYSFNLNKFEKDEENNIFERDLSTKNNSNIMNNTMTNSSSKGNKNEEINDIIIEDNSNNNQEIHNPLDLGVAELNKELENHNENYEPNNQSQSAAPQETEENEENHGLFKEKNFTSFFKGNDSKRKENLNQPIILSLLLPSLNEGVRFMKNINRQNHTLKTEDLRYNLIEYIILIHEKNNVKKKINSHKRLLNAPDLMTEFTNQEDIPIILNENFKREELEFLKKEYNMKNISYQSSEIFTKLFSNLKAFRVVCENIEEKGFLYEDSEVEYLYKCAKILYLSKTKLYILDENFSKFQIEHLLKDDKFYSYENNSEIYPILRSVNYTDITEIRYEGDYITIDYTYERRFHKEIEIRVVNSQEGEVIYSHLLNSYIHEARNM